MRPQITLEINEGTKIAKKIHETGVILHQIPFPKNRAVSAEVKRPIPSGVVGLHSIPLIYLNIPKSACSTIKNHMFFMEHGRYIDEPLSIHSTPGLIKSKDGGIEAMRHFERTTLGKHFIFSFVRNPGRRAYSCFTEKIVHLSKYSFPRIRAHLIESYGLQLEKTESPCYNLELHIQNFANYLKFVRDNLRGKTAIRKDAHWGLQTNMIENFQSYFFIDFIGRVESFEKHFSFITSELNPKHQPDINLRFNEGPKPPFPFEALLSDEVIQLLNDIYAADYRNFGYPHSTPTI